MWRRSQQADRRATELHFFSGEAEAQDAAQVVEPVVGSAKESVLNGARALGPVLVLHYSFGIGDRPGGVGIGKDLEPVEACLRETGYLQSYRGLESAPHRSAQVVEHLIRGVVAGDEGDAGAAVAAGDRIAAHPMFEAIDIGSTARVRPAPLRDPRFVGDVNLGGQTRRTAPLVLRSGHLGHTQVSECQLEVALVEYLCVCFPAARGLDPV